MTRSCQSLATIAAHCRMEKCRVDRQFNCLDPPNQGAETRFVGQGISATKWPEMASQQADTKDWHNKLTQQVGTTDRHEKPARTGRRRQSIVDVARRQDYCEGSAIIRFCRLAQRWRAVDPDSASDSADSALIQRCFSAGSTLIRRYDAVGKSVARPSSLHASMSVSAVFKRVVTASMPNAPSTRCIGGCASSVIAIIASAMRTGSPA